MSEATRPTTKQLEILRLFYRFRFLTSNQLIIMLGLKRTNPNQIHQRLTKLLANKYIDRNYSPQFKIDRRPAEYFLIDGGIGVLKQFMADKCNNKVLHNLYNDKKAQPSSVAHYLRIGSIYCCLRERYGDNLKFFTKSQIAPYKYFPKQKPEALIRLEVGDGQKEFFLEIINPNTPFFSYVGRVKRYIEYSDAGTWQDETGKKLPGILFMADSVSTEIRIQKQAARLVKRHYDDEPKVYTSNLDKLKTIRPGYDRVWRDVEEPKEVLGLHEI